MKKILLLSLLFFSSFSVLWAEPYYDNSNDNDSDGVVEYILKKNWSEIYTVSQADNDNDGITDAKVENGKILYPDLCKGSNTTNNWPVDENGCTEWQNQEIYNIYSLGIWDICPGTVSGEIIELTGNTRGCSENQKIIDTDNNNIPDYLDTDDDGDGIPDANEIEGYEFTYISNDSVTPNETVTIHVYMNPKMEDTDGDGLTDAEEKTQETNANAQDSDLDGVLDGIDNELKTPGNKKKYIDENGEYSSDIYNNWDEDWDGEKDFSEDTCLESENIAVFESGYYQWCTKSQRIQSIEQGKKDAEIYQNLLSKLESLQKTLEDKWWNTWSDSEKNNFYSSISSKINLYTNIFNTSIKDFAGIPENERNIKDTLTAFQWVYDGLMDEYSELSETYTSWEGISNEDDDGLTALLFSKQANYSHTDLDISITSIGTGKERSELKIEKIKDTSQFNIETTGNKGLQNFLFRIARDLKTFVTAIASIILLYAGFRFFLSSSDQEEFKKWRATLIWSIIGILLMNMSYAFIGIFFDQKIDDNLAGNFNDWFLFPIARLLSYLGSFAFLMTAFISFFRTIFSAGSEEIIKKAKSGFLYSIIGFILLKIIPTIITSVYGKYECESQYYIFETCSREYDFWEGISLIARVINYVNGFAALISIILIIWAGFLLLTSAGNEEKIKKVKSIILYIALGFIIIISSSIILNFYIDTGTVN